MSGIEWYGFCHQTLCSAISNSKVRAIMAYAPCNCSACNWYDNNGTRQIVNKTEIKNCSKTCTDKYTGYDGYLDEYANTLSTFPENKHNVRHNDIEINLLHMETTEAIKERYTSKTKFIRIYEHNAETFLESGSYTSVINREFAELLNSKNQLISWKGTSLDDLVIERLDGTIMTTSGKVTLQLMIGDQPFECEFLVVDLFKRRCIVGREFIEKNEIYMDWQMCPMLFWGYYPMDLYCRNSTLKIRVEVQNRHCRPDISDHWLIYILIMHIGGDMCSHVIKATDTQLDQVLSELLDMKKEGLGIELTTSKLEPYCFSPFSDYNESLIKTDNITKSEIHETDWDKSLRQKFGKRMGNTFNTEKEETIICSTPSLENLAVDSIIRNEKNRKYLIMKQKQGQKWERTGIDNLFHRNIKHDMITTCIKWRYLSLFENCHSYLYKERGVISPKEHITFENIEI